MATESRIKTNQLLIDDLEIQPYLFKIDSSDSKNTRKYYKELSRMIEGHYSKAAEWLASDEAKRYYKEEAIYKREAFERMDFVLDDLVKNTKLSVDEIIQRIYDEGKKYGYRYLDQHLKYTQADKYAIKYARSYNYTLINSLSNDMRDTIKNEITKGVLTGRSISETRSEIYRKAKGRLDGSTFTPYERASMIARTETSRANNTGILQSYVNEGVHRVKILTAEDSNVCTTCLKYAYEYNTDEVTIENKGKDKLHDIEDLLKNSPCLPLHPNCRCTYVADIDSIYPLSTDVKPVDLTPPNDPTEIPKLMSYSEMEEFFKKYGYKRGELPPKIEGYFTTYTTSAHSSFNAYLRGDKSFERAKEDWERESKYVVSAYSSCDFVSFEEALEISKNIHKYSKILKEDILIVRGESKRHILPDDNGEYTTPHPTSCSTDINKAESFGDIFSYIVIPKGSRIYPIANISDYPHEREVLLAENITLKKIDDCPIDKGYNSMLFKQLSK